MGIFMKNSDEEFKEKYGFDKNELFNVILHRRYNIEITWLCLIV